VLAKPQSAGVVLRPATINGELGVLYTLGDHPVGALTFDLVDGRILNLRLQINPDKLGGLRPNDDPTRP
jgi:RNA polymerase sigma-70 factor (ECF subfamily)